jgi:hypothetical protein
MAGAALPFLIYVRYRRMSLLCCNMRPPPDCLVILSSFVFICALGFVSSALAEQQHWLPLSEHMWRALAELQYPVADMPFSVLLLTSGEACFIALATTLIAVGPRVDHHLQCAPLPLGGLRT